MVSEAAARALAVSGAWADPFLWASAAAFSAGLAGGQCLRAFVTVREAATRALRRRPRRLARAVCFLSLGLLALAGLLVLPGRPLPLDRDLPADLVGLLLCCAAGFLAGFRPLACGAPVLVLASAAGILFHLGIEGWTAYVPDPGGRPRIVATVLPYEVGQASFRGHLEIEVPGSGGDGDSAWSGGALPSGAEIGLPSSSCALRVECLQFRGELGLLAELEVRLREVPARTSTPARARAPDLGSPPRFYRIAGVSAPGGLAQDVTGPPHLALLDRLQSLPAAGPEPGAAALARSLFGGLSLRSRLASPAAPLFPLTPVRFRLGFEGDAPKLSVEAEQSFLP